jgi:inner membrane protein
VRAPTHAAFGLGFTIATGTVLGVTLTPAVAAAALFGALAPDLDTPASLAGRACPPLARWLERRVGHRTVTHSLLGLGLASLAALPLLWIDRSWALAFGLGYLSHVLVDAANPPGIPLFYPSAIRAVFPGRERLRPAEGSRGEAVLCAGFLLGLAILAPLHLIGFTRALHVLTGTVGGAITDFRRWEGTHEVWADLDGLFRLSQRPVRQRVLVLGVANTSTLIVLDPATGRVHTVGPAESANVFPRTVVARPGRAVRVETRPVPLTQQLLRDVLREIPADGETYLHGIVRTPDTPALQADPEAYETLKAGMGALELHFARAHELEDPRVGSVFVLSGQVLVQTVRAADAPVAAARVSRPSAAEYDDVTELFIAKVTDPGRELLVRDGVHVQRGQLLARLRWKDPELERQRQQLRADLVERELTEALRAAAVRQVEALVAAGLAAPSAVGRAEAELVAARDATAGTRRALDRLAEEARRATEVRAPVAGQVLSVRVHVIHGSESTARLRLLYRRHPRIESAADPDLAARESVSPAIR